MAKADRLKEEIGWLKVVFAIGVALGASMVAWLAQNYADGSKPTVYGAFVGVVCVTLLVAAVIRRIYHCFGELEKS